MPVVKAVLLLTMKPFAKPPETTLYITPLYRSTRLTGRQSNSPDTSLSAPEQAEAFDP